MDFFFRQTFSPSMGELQALSEVEGELKRGWAPPPTEIKTFNFEH